MFRPPMQKRQTILLLFLIFMKWNCIVTSFTFPHLRSHRHLSHQGHHHHKKLMIQQHHQRKYYDTFKKISSRSKVIAIYSSSTHTDTTNSDCTKNVSDQSFSSQTETTRSSSSSSSLIKSSPSFAELYHNLGAFSYTYKEHYENDKLQNDDNNENNNNNNKKNHQRDLELCETPLLTLSSGTASTPEEHCERGVLLTQNVKRDSILLSIPLSSCLCDDSPPDWFYACEEMEETVDLIKDVDENEEEAEKKKDEEEDDDDKKNSREAFLTDQTNHHLHNPSQWATRLAASFLELQYSTPTTATTTTTTTSSSSLDVKNPHKRQKGLTQWMSMRPNPSSLRASLPVHWSDEALSKARCFALELAVDSAYFSRAEAVDALLDGLKRRRKRKQKQRLQKQLQQKQDGKKEGNVKEEMIEEEEEEEEGILAAHCHSALDFVQTRVCRVDRLNGLQPPMRILAPIFDFINHGGNQNSNAYFQLEEQGINLPPRPPNDDNDSEEGEEDDRACLVVRASRDMRKGEEVLINYGSESTKPAWRCLASYGFVPEEDEEEDDNEEHTNVAEVFMDGVRYEVGKNSVPIDMVLATAATIASENEEYELLTQEETTATTIDDDDDEEIAIDSHSSLSSMDANILHQEEEALLPAPSMEVDENPLTAAVALRIAKRVSDVAFDLLLENANTSPTSIIPKKEPSSQLAQEEDGKNDINDDDDDDDDDDDYENEQDSESAAEIQAASLAASLRYSQHRVLMACAMGLKDYAGQNMGF